MRINICGIRFHYQLIFCPCCIVTCEEGILGKLWKRKPKRITKASGKMKLISVAAFLTYLTAKVNTQNLQHEQYPFPPQFQTPSSAAFPTENSLYLPPENHPPMPYYPIKNLNNLQFQYLPPTGTKAPQMYPTPFPMMVSSVPSFDEDEDEDDDEHTGRIQLPSTPQSPRPFNNRTQQNAPPKEDRKEPRSLPKTVSYRHPIDRTDIKFPFQMGSPPTPNQTPASRRMIISAETTRTDQLQDQVKMASSNGLQYLPAPPGFLASTTEPAIPILRLSNEMDLDGSYSYEALGADQTHYVQHSRMENMGTEKEEQVVEGSYSYVGDNGQTFTVHYVADGNGFRASGDHLPVAPPVPEIIQRSIQYNLAEEARRPPHLKHSWEDEIKEHEISERISDKEKNHHHFTLTPPPRNLFTGKQPEAFSYSYGQGPNQVQSTSLVTAASNNIPVKTVEFTKDQTQMKQNNNGPISPQITFLASQGAHVPSVNAQQQSISRMFINAEKPPMPQLMNYEATTKETEQENNKSLWRWQYGLNANNVNSEMPAKNSISRSFGEGDDVMINFSDMTQEQYTNMIRSQMEANVDGYQETESPRFMQVNPFERNQINNPYKQYQQQTQAQIPHTVTKPTTSIPRSSNWFSQNYKENTVAQLQNENHVENHQVLPRTDPTIMEQTEIIEEVSKPATQTNFINTPQSNEWPKKDYYNKSKNSKANYYNHENDKQPLKENKEFESTEPDETSKVKESRYVPDARSKLVTSKHFTPPSQTVTQSYDYDENFFEVRKIKSFNHDKANLVTKKPTYTIPSTQTENIVTTTNENYNSWFDNNNIKVNAFTSTNENLGNWLSKDNFVNKNSISTEPILIPSTESPAFTTNSLKFSDFISHEEEKSSDFKPIFTTERVEKEPTTTTTETSIEDMFNNNIFLKNLVRNEKPAAIKHQNSIVEEPKKQASKPKSSPEPSMEKTSKHIHQTLFNDMKVMKHKPLDISDMLNYVSLKNHFEPGKVKPKKQNGFPDHLNQRKEVYYSNIEGEQKEKENENHRLRSQQQEELRGIIKNYKVLQRNNNMNMNVQHNNQPNKDINNVPYRIMQAPNLPPLGRAGPAAKSYLPPIFV